MMHYSLFLASFGETDFAPLRCLISSHQNCGKKSQQQDQMGVDDVMIAVCVVDQNFECVRSSKEVQWQAANCVEVDGLIQDTGASSAAADTCVTEKQTKLWDYLHDVADKLPYAGFTLDIVIVNPTICSESCTNTLGALLRLREWHGARLTLVVGEDQQEERAVQLLSSVVHARLLTTASLSSVGCPVWRGCVVWPNKRSIGYHGLGARLTLVVGEDQQEERAVQLLSSVVYARLLTAASLSSVGCPVWRGCVVWPGEKGFVQHGLSLQCDDLDRLRRKLWDLYFWVSSQKAEVSGETGLVFGRHLEVLACVNLASVPLYLFDNFTLQLHMDSEASFGQLIRALTRKDALLLRIALYEKDSIPVASPHGLSTAAWKDGIATTGKPMSDPEKETLPCRQHLFLLLTGNQSGAGPLTAVVMRSPSEVTAEVFEEAHHASYFSFPCRSEEEPSSLSKKTYKVVQGLPLLTAADFHTTDTVWLESIIQCVNEEKGKSEGDVELTTGELLSYVREGHELFLQQGGKQQPRLSGAAKPVTDQDFLTASDLQDASEWPERRALLDSESKAKVLRRYQSNDSCSMMLSSPLAPEESSMDAKDIVKWFKPDGNAVNEDLSPIKAVVHPQQMSSHMERALQWPACKDLQYHDVYYEHIKKCERQEKFFQKFRDNIMLEESHHVCADKPHVPALRFRKHHGKSQMDISCGGSKLTPITRVMSPSSMLMATPSAKKRLSEGSSRDAKHTWRKQSSQEDSHFSVPKSRARKERSLSTGGEKGRRSLGASREERSGVPSSRSSLHYAHQSDQTLPPFRRVSQSDTVSIFTPPVAQKRLSRSASLSLASHRDRLTGEHSTQSSVSATDASHLKRQWSSESMDSAGVPGGADQCKSRDSRSQRHKHKLEKIVSQVLVAAGVGVNDTLYTSCFSKLFQVTKFFVKQLPHSHNLKTEMRSIAEKQVQQVVDLERRRQDLAVKKKLRKSSLVGDSAGDAKQGKNAFL